MIENRINFTNRRIPNNLYRYSTLKEVNHHSPLLKLGLYMVTFLLRVLYGMGGWYNE